MVLSTVLKCGPEYMYIVQMKCNVGDVQHSVYSWQEGSVFSY